MREKAGPDSLPAPSVKQRNLLLGGQQLDRGCNQAIALTDGSYDSGDMTPTILMLFP